MQIAIAIVNFRTPELTVACLTSVLAEREALPGLRAVVVDNCSADGSPELLASALADPRFAGWVDFVALPRNGGFGWGNNQAILHMLRGASPPDAILLLNPDTRIEPGAIAALARDLVARPDAGAVGAQLLNQDGSLSGSAFRFPSIGREFMRGCAVGGIGRLLGIAPTLVPPGERGPVDWVTGACVLLRTCALRETGLFDTGFFLYFEEVELMHRLRRHGWRSYHCPESRVVHVNGASTGVSFDGDEAPPPPPYVQASRYRYFGLTKGKLGAFLAASAWLAGTFLGQALARPMGRTYPASWLAERRQLLAMGLSQTWRPAQPAAATAADPCDLPPAWEKIRNW